MQTHESTNIADEYLSGNGSRRRCAGQLGAVPKKLDTIRDGLRDDTWLLLRVKIAMLNAQRI